MTSAIVLFGELPFISRTWPRVVSNPGSPSAPVGLLYVGQSDNVLFWGPKDRLKAETYGMVGGLGGNDGTFSGLMFSPYMTEVRLGLSRACQSAQILSNHE